ncbi:MAG: hypothetical protein J7D60_06790 [Prosthecochloris sp.]|nr:hypothetical protein [Prosthecochloris sp.]
MKKPVLAGLFGLCCFVLLLLAGCAREKVPSEQPSEMYERARQLASRYEDAAALELVSRALAIDTLDGKRPETARAIQLQARLLERNGELFRSLETYRVLEDCCASLLSDEMVRESILSRAQILSDLGYHDEVIGLLENFKPATSHEKLSVARIYEEVLLPEHSVPIYLSLEDAADAALRLQALSGLLHLSRTLNVKGLSRSEVYALETVEAARDLLEDVSHPDEYKAAVLRKAACRLQETGRHDSDASYLLFKALSLARAAGSGELEALLDYESNAVLQADPEVYARSSGYFDEHGMGLSYARALVWQAESGVPDERERLELLKTAFRYFLQELPPGRAGMFSSVFRDGTSSLLSLLAANGGYSTAFMVDEELRSWELSAIVLENQLTRTDRFARLQKEVYALQRRILRLLEEGVQVERIHRLRRFVNEKRGELSSSDGSGVLTSAVTLKTLQQSLGAHEAVIRVVPSKEWLTVMFIRSDMVDVSRSRITRDEFLSLAGLMSGHLQTGRSDALRTLSRHHARLKLSNILAGPFMRQLRQVEHLTVMSATPLPFRLLGDNRYLGRDMRISQIPSAREFLLDRSRRTVAGIDPVVELVIADSAAVARRLLVEGGGREIFLFWKPLTQSERDDLRVLLSMALKERGEPSRALLQLTAGDRGGSDAWLALSSFSADDTGAQ